MTLRHFLAFALLASALLTSAPAEAATTYDMVFPIAGPVEFENTWGNARSGGRRHRGTDLMADKMVPVVAVADGVVDWVHDGGRKDCCALGIEHDDGWQSWYIHMNNDTPGTDDGQGWGFAPGIDEGVRVSAGQLIGWVGDSGNAEHTPPHIHFELHRPDGTAINPYASLLAASPVDAPTIPGLDETEVAVTLSEAVYPDGSTRVVVAPRGVEGAPTVHAGIRPGVAPVLLTDSTSIADATLAELRRLQPTFILIVGDERWISSGVVADIEAATGIAPVRVTGPMLTLSDEDPDGEPAVFGLR